MFKSTDKRSRVTVPRQIFSLKRNLKIIIVDLSRFGARGWWDEF